MHEAKTHLSRLLARVEAGEEILIRAPVSRSHGWFPPGGPGQEAARALRR